MESPGGFFLKNKQTARVPRKFMRRAKRFRKLVRKAEKLRNLVPKGKKFRKLVRKAKKARKLPQSSLVEATRATSKRIIFVRMWKLQRPVPKGMMKHRAEIRKFRRAVISFEGMLSEISM